MENKQIKMELENAKSLIDNLTKIFSKGQIKRLTNPVNKNHWNWEDISQAICLHAAGPRAYRHLYNKGYPLSHDSTLRKWPQKIEMSEGVLWFSLDIMRNSTEVTKGERICVLIFDEKPSNYVQVAIVRGLKKSWKQPVFNSFDCPMTKEIVCLLIRELSERDYAVVAMVSDMGSCNRKLWKDLNVTIESPWFANPACLDEKVFVFADPPHLIKLIRNHYFDTGLLWNATLLTNRTLIDLVRILSGSDLSIAYKLTEEHLSARGASRQKVKLASQVFSNTNANAIRRCYYLGEDLYSPLESADCLQLVNDWFDVLNSKMTTFSLPGKKPYGKDLVHQDKVLRKMNEWMSQNIVPGKKSVQIFQQGVLVTNNALQLLYEYLSERYNMEYILTYRLNQDPLEYLFGAIRSSGGLNDHPSPQEFKYRLRKYILDDNTQWLPVVANYNISSQCSSIIEQSAEKSLEESCEIENSPLSSDCTQIDEFSQALRRNSFVDNSGCFEEDALDYISGYIIRKMNLKEFESKETNFTLIDQISKGG